MKQYVKDKFIVLRDKGIFAISNSEQRDHKIFETGWNEAVKYITKQIQENKS
jgi:hypothetical protein